MHQNNSSRKRNNRSDVPRIQRWTAASEASSLLDFLLAKLAGQSKTSLKTLFRNRQVSVNGQAVCKDIPLRPADRIEIDYAKRRVDFSHPLLKIVWEDDSLIVVEKSAGLLSMATDREKNRTAYHLLSEYVKKSNPANRIFILHRLDRETSGLMMFAKNQSVQHELQDNWSEMITRRTYVAVVEGCPEKETDLLTSYLAENAGLKVYVTSVGGQEAIMRYTVLKSNGVYSLLKLELETGRKNQIRAQLESIGCPVAGDPKYGAATNPARRLMLHASALGFVHPVTNREMAFETSVPSSFNGLVKKRE